MSYETLLTQISEAAEQRNLESEYPDFASRRRSHTFTQELFAISEAVSLEVRKQLLRIDGFVSLPEEDPQSLEAESRRID